MFNHAVKQWVVTALQTVPPEVNFVLDRGHGQRVHCAPHQYARVAHSVKNNTISLQALPRDKMESTAMYNPENNHMTLSYDVFQHPAAVIHEGTHALIDLERHVMLVPQNEAIAYIAHSMYLAICKKPPFKPKPYHQAALNLAKELLALKRAKRILHRDDKRFRALEKMLAQRYPATAKAILGPEGVIKWDCGCRD